MGHTMSDIMAATVTRGDLQSVGDGAYTLIIGGSKLQIADAAGGPDGWGFTVSRFELEPDGTTWALTSTGRGTTELAARAEVAGFIRDAVAREAGVAIGDHVLIPAMGTRMWITVSEIHYQRGKLLLRGRALGSTATFESTTWEKP